MSKSKLTESETSYCHFSHLKYGCFLFPPFLSKISSKRGFEEPSGGISLSLLPSWNCSKLLFSCSRFYMLLSLLFFSFVIPFNAGLVMWSARSVPGLELSCHTEHRNVALRTSRFYTNARIPRSLLIARRWLFADEKSSIGCMLSWLGWRSVYWVSSGYITVLRNWNHVTQFSTVGSSIK